LVPGELSSAPGGNNLLLKLRVDKLRQELPWVGVEQADAALRHNMGRTDAALAELRQRYPAPPKSWKPKVPISSSKTVDPMIGLGPGDRLNASARHATSARRVSTGGSVAAQYTELRAEAAALSRARNHCFVQAASAAARGDPAAARRLGAEGRRIAADMFAAADAIFAARNPEGSSTVDLHGLHVREAVERLEYDLEMRSRGDVVHVVTGTGLHSTGSGGRSRLRPAILQFLKEKGYSFREARDSNQQGGAFTVYL